MAGLRLLPLLLALLMAAGCQQAKPLPKMFPLPEFSLTERSGKQVAKSDLAGKVWVGNFFFASCPSICKDMNAGMKSLQDTFADQEGVRLVSITTDAENDTPAVLQTYAQSIGAGERWLFLTGKKAELYQLSIDGFKLALQENTGTGDPIIHSSKLVLVDKTGTIRGYYDGIDAPSGGSNAPAKTAKEERERLVADIRRLLKE